ncbi:lytic murein transglycosylase [Aliiroseovarius sp. KMU-50]|uniref:Lytic murein transglycosylase n=1 Tax=Aliiroseovarius salicola TaxID=3009082 RepID=A0ABT4W1B2_9RHOB|nr:lytic murein transglycosylase [Aliiroseovarius sp. KMU-50]MDA5094251.1 lytic murein transglycosylase [Aliiroseovarius sp. KMU-50]
MMDRRQFSMMTGAAILAGCNSAGQNVPQSHPPVTRSDSRRFLPQKNAGLDAWVNRAFARARANGISDRTLRRAKPHIGFLPEVVNIDRNQTEFKRSFEDYLAIATSENRVATGRAMLRRHAGLLSKIEATYGVEKEVVIAVWGLESRYGARKGDVPTLSALATLAHDGRRARLFERQFQAALRILENGDITPARMMGSWAGAMGHTQFMPTSYLSFAVDFDHDGRRDIWRETPTDALASAAAYLARNGWRKGARWGQESASGAIAPAGSSGPRFNKGANYRVLGSYNNAQKYIIGVGILSDLIAGRPGLRHEFGPDVNGMRLKDRIALQKGLARAGYDVGEPDGVIGPKTLAAISAYEQAQGLTVSGQPSLALLSRL